MGVRIAIASYGTFEQFIHQIKPFYSEEVEFVILNALFEDLKGEVRRLEKEHSVDVFVGSGEMCIRDRPVEEQVRRIRSLTVPLVPGIPAVSGRQV